MKFCSHVEDPGSFQCRFVVVYIVFCSEDIFLSCRNRMQHLQMKDLLLAVVDQSSYNFETVLETVVVSNTVSVAQLSVSC